MVDDRQLDNAEEHFDPEADTQENVSIDKTEIDEIVREIKTAQKNRDTWETKLRVFYERRYGLRGEKTEPWPGAANINIPLVDKAIRRAKPVYVSSVFNVNPIVQVEPFGAPNGEFASNVEYGYDWLVRHRMKRAREAVIHVTDAMTTFGFGVVKCFWDYETEYVRRKLRFDFAPADFDIKNPTPQFEAELARQLGLNMAKKEDLEALQDALSQVKAGKKQIEIRVTTERVNAPRWEYVDPRDIIVPWDAGTDVDELPWLCHRMTLTERQLRQRRASGRFDGEAVMKLIRSGPQSATDETSSLPTVREMREGVSAATGKKPTNFEVWEVFTWYDIDGDGVPERVVITLAPGSGDSGSTCILRMVEYPYEHKQWPFTRFPYEMTEPRWYSSRGIPELLFDINEEINAQHNAKLDNMKLQNAKMFKVRQGSINNPNKIRVKPGGAVEVRRMDDIDTINHQVMDFSFDNEERILKAYAEEYVGISDFGLSNVNQNVERRTATEVSEISRISGLVQDLDLKVFQEGMRRLHFQTLRLWAQFGEMEVLVRVDGTEEPVIFSRFDLDNDFELAPTGRVDNLDGRTRANQALIELQTLAGNPATAPFVNTLELVKDYLQNRDHRGAQRKLQEPGVFQSNESRKQVAEVSEMLAIGEVSPVNLGDAHEIHIQTVQKALVANQDDEGLLFLLQHHLALHLFALKDPSLLNQLIEGGAQFQQIGQQLFLTPAPPQPQQPQPEAPPEEA